MNSRPLSPFLVYRFMYTMVLSFAHRMTGLGLSVGAILLTYALAAVASGGAAFETARRFFGHWTIRTLLALIVTAFFFHLANGIRHLFWDAGVGYEKAQARRSGALVIVATVLLCALAAWVAMRAGSAA